MKNIADQGRFAPVGQGTIDFSRILANRKLSGKEYFFVEQDRTFDGMTPLEAVAISYGGLEEM